MSETETEISEWFGPGLLTVRLSGEEIHFIYEMRPGGALGAFDVDAALELQRIVRRILAIRATGEPDLITVFNAAVRSLR